MHPSRRPQQSLFAPTHAAEVGLWFTGVNEDYIHKPLAERHTFLSVDKDDCIVFLEPSSSHLVNMNIHRGRGKEKQRHLWLRGQLLGATGHCFLECQQRRFLLKKAMNPEAA